MNIILDTIGGNLCELETATETIHMKHREKKRVKTYCNHK